jgi:LPXTG-site transpeptidase (sortase) family protein
MPKRKTSRKTHRLVRKARKKLLFWKRNISRRLRPLTSYAKKHVPAILAVLGVLLMVASGVHHTLRLQALSLSKEIIHNQVVQKDTRKPRATRIFIQWFVDSTIEETAIQEGVWSISEVMTSHLGESARPGEPGNIILYGHNTRAILGNIRALKGGEIIHLYTEDGVDHQYRITTRKEVSPKDVQFLFPTTEETLTMYTCSGLFDAKRFIVQAKPM